MATTPPPDHEAQQETEDDVDELAEEDGNEGPDEGAAGENEETNESASESASEQTEEWSDEEDHVPNYCVAQSRCAFCQFSFVGSDTLVAVINRAVTQEIQFAQASCYRDPGDAFRVCMCGHVRCVVAGQPVVAMHAECCRFAVAVLGEPPDWEDSSPLFDAVEHMYPVSTRDEQQRADMIQETLARRLSRMPELWETKDNANANANTSVPPLPLEIWSMVARHLVRPCSFMDISAVILREYRLYCQSNGIDADQMLGLDNVNESPDAADTEAEVEAGDNGNDANKDSDTDSDASGFGDHEDKITLEKPVYGSYLSIEGRCYVRRLYNGDRGDTGTKKDGVLRLCLFPGFSRVREIGAMGVRIFVGMDHLGVRCVRFFPLYCMCRFPNVKQEVNGTVEVTNKFCTEKRNTAMEAWCRARQKVPVPGVSWDCVTVDFDQYLDRDGGRQLYGFPTLEVICDAIKIRRVIWVYPPDVLANGPMDDATNNGRSRDGNVDINSNINDGHGGDANAQTDTDEDSQPETGTQHDQESDQVPDDEPEDEPDDEPDDEMGQDPAQDPDQEPDQAPGQASDHEPDQDSDHEPDQQQEEQQQQHPPPEPLTRRIIFSWPVPLTTTPSPLLLFQPPRSPAHGAPININIQHNVMDMGMLDAYRMRLVPFNMPRTVGYSYASDGVNVYAIIAHTRNEAWDKHVEAYSDAGLEKCCWVYVPLRSGETVGAISVCTAYWKSYNQDAREKVGFYIKTDYRDLVFGAFWGRTLQHARIHDPASKAVSHRPFTMFFSRVDAHRDSGDLRAMALVAFSGPIEPDPTRRIRAESWDRPRYYELKDLDGKLTGRIRRRHGTTVDSRHRFAPLSPQGLPRFGVTQRALYSVCSLSEVDRVQVCRDPTDPAPVRRVVGLRLVYTEESRLIDAHVGQWRFDWAAQTREEFRVSPGSAGLGICCQVFGPWQGERRQTILPYCGPYYVSAVSTSTPTSTSSSTTSAHADDEDDSGGEAGQKSCYEKERYLIPWRGILEWWFIRNEIALYHNGAHILDEDSKYRLQ